MLKKILIIITSFILILFAACVHDVDENVTNNITDDLSNMTDNITENIDNITGNITGDIDDIVNNVTNNIDNIIENVTNNSNEGDNINGNDNDMQNGESEIVLNSFAGDFTSPLKIVVLDEERYLVADQIGIVWLLNSSGDKQEEPFLDISERIVDLNQNYDERGLLGIAVHPDFEENGFFYVYYSKPLSSDAPSSWDHTSVIARFNSIGNFADEDSFRIIMEVDQPQSNHNGGDMIFGPDGYLYVSLGDGGGANDVGEGHPDMGNGQDTSTLLGSIIRIDVDSDTGGESMVNYVIPDDNPFVDDENVLDEIYAYGFRNAIGMSFDEDGNLFVADVGQNRYEEVNIVLAGMNYGWNIKEGNECFDPETPNELNVTCMDETENLIEPVIVYGNTAIDDGIGSAVIGGYVYDGGNTQLQGEYLFGDWQGLFMKATPNIEEFESMDGLNVSVWDFEIIFEFDDMYILGFGEDMDGELFVLTTQNSGPRGNTGEIFILR